MSAGDAVAGGSSTRGVAVVTATVREILPRALYRVTTENGHDVVAHAQAGLGRNFVRLVVGDSVVVELSPRDVGRGRVVKKR